MQTPRRPPSCGQRLEGMSSGIRPEPGQSTDDAIAELRDEFDVRIDNFTQDAKLDALAEAQNQGGQLDRRVRPSDR